ncbi:MAG: hypothetical protein DCC49_01035 [Acidobacteria bacterium]|nr:MAG: hypothetical protein DCC49_01035 [Acidobacteriota bacterium]
MPKRDSTDKSARETGGASGDREVSGRRGFFSSLAAPPREGDDEGADRRPRRPPLKWRAVLLGTGAMLFGSILLQLAIAPVASKSQLVSFSPGEGRAKVVSSGGRGPAGIAYDLKGQRVWMANSLSGEVASLVPNSGGTPERISVGKGPVAIGVDPVSGNLVIANSGSNDISVLDPASRNATATIGSGDNPAGVAIAARARRAFVTNLRSADVTVVDLDSKVVIARVPVGKDPQPITVSSQSERVLVAVTGDNEIKAIDSASGAITGTIRTSSTPVALAPMPDGTVAAALLQDKQVVLIDPPTMTITKTTTLPARPTALAVNPNTGQVVAVSWESSKAYVVDSLAQTVLEETDLGVIPSSVAIDPESGTYFSYGGVPVPAALNVAYIALLLLVICAGGFVAGFVSKQEPVRHASFALGGLALIIWLVLAGGRVEALFAVAFSSAFALPAAALGGFLAGRKTGEIETGLKATLIGAISGRKATASEPDVDAESSGGESPATGDSDAQSDRPDSKRRRTRRTVDSAPLDEPLD